MTRPNDMLHSYPGGGPRETARAAGRLAAAGLVAGVVSGTPTTLAWLAGAGPGPLAATREIGRRACGHPSLLAGGALHLALSATFAAPVPLLARARRPVATGSAHGALLYLVNFRLVAPRAWPQARRFDGAAQLGDHVAYGVVAALAWRRLSRRR